MCYKIVDNLKMRDIVNILQPRVKVVKLQKWPQIMELNSNMEKQQASSCKKNS